MGNIREMKKILGEMGVEFLVVGDTSDVFDTPTDGTFRMYMGGTRLSDMKKAVNARATLSFQEYTTPKSLEYAASLGQKTLAFNYPIGIRGTDRWLMAISELTGKSIP